jgi:ABC-type transport system involved in multi-copper enzyme maturation permease subunit
LRTCALGAVVPVLAMLALLLVFGYPEGGGHRGPLALIGPASLIYLGSFGALSIAIGSFKFWQYHRSPNRE